MAEARRNQRLPSGYDEDFVNAVEDENFCLICHLALKEPVQTRCGHKFCKECLEEHFRRQEAQDQPLTCPADREGLDRDREVFYDKAAERKILSLAIKCPSEGCAWTGELRRKETHLASCPFRDVPCTNDNCKVTLKRKDLSEHVRATCQWRIVLCEHCSEPQPKCQMEDLEGHFKICERFPVRCPNKCEALVPREMVLNHIEHDCPLTNIPCPYAWMGCRTEVQRDQLESHIECATKSHLDLACGLVLLAYYLTEVEDRVQKNFEVKLIQILEEGVNKHLEEKLTVIQSLHESKVGMVRKDLEDGIQKKLDDKDSIIKNLEGKVRTILEEKLRVIQNLHERIVKLEMDPEASHIFIWKIKDFENQMKNNEDSYIRSVPFYAYGYKLMVRLYPKYLDKEENPHLSIYITVMKGEYDAILPWGFSKKVSLTLIDQQDNPDQRHDVAFEFTANPNNEVFKKPVEGEDRSALGFREFVSHSDLRTRRFIVDDTIFIKVQVAN